MKAQKKARCFDSGDGFASADRISWRAYGGTKPIDYTSTSGRGNTGIDNVPNIALHSSRVRSMMRSRELDARRNHNSEYVGCLHASVNILRIIANKPISLFPVFQIFSEQVLVFEVGR